jgi:hypothetical protein
MPTFDDRDDQHLLVERVCVFDLGAQRQWRRRFAGVEEDGHPGDADERWVLFGQAVEELVQRALFGDPVAGDDTWPRRHGT